MSSAEWQNAFHAWMVAGAVQQELWRRLSHAQITDADQPTLEAQRRMEQLSAEHASQMVRLMLEANPALRDELAISDFVTNFLKNVTSLDRRAPIGIDRAYTRRR